MSAHLKDSISRTRGAFDFVIINRLHQSQIRDNLVPGFEWNTHSHCSVAWRHVEIDTSQAWIYCCFFAIWQFSHFEKPAAWFVSRSYVNIYWISNTAEYDVYENNLLDANATAHKHTWTCNTHFPFYSLKWKIEIDDNKRAGSLWISIRFLQADNSRFCATSECGFRITMKLYCRG